MKTGRDKVVFLQGNPIELVLADAPDRVGKLAFRGAATISLFTPARRG